MLTFKKFPKGTGNVREDLPPAGDILNPDAVASFMELVYERFAREFGGYFGTTILGIFTDEPDMLDQGRRHGAKRQHARLTDVDQSGRPARTTRTKEPVTPGYLRIGSKVFLIQEPD